MSSPLAFRQYVELPFHPTGDFDHGDVWHLSGDVFLANTAAGTVEVVDGASLSHKATIPGCPEASGVLVVQESALVFAAARGAGQLLMIDPETMAVKRSIAVGSRPNGLAWDARHHHLLVADVQDHFARLVDPQTGQLIAATHLPGRPRWAVYAQSNDRFLVNIREPALVAILDAETAALVGQFPISASGPHGLDLDREGNRAFVACDGGRVVILDLATGSELASASIAGAPDAIWYHHRASRLYVAIKDPGIIEVVNTMTMTVEQQISTEPGAHTTAFDERRQRLFVFLPSCRVAVYEESEVS